MMAAKKAQETDFPDGIPECGADALRFGLLAYTVQGRDVNLDIARVVGYRQFCNKLWNAVKFALTYLGDFTPSEGMYGAILACGTERDLFILSRLNSTIRDANLHMENYSFAAVTTSLHSFFIYDLCDVYLELIKPIVAGGEGATVDASVKYAAQATLYTCLEQYLRLAHPIMPFVTEELWQRLPNLASLTSVPSIMISRYPEAVPAWFNPQAEEGMKVVLDAIHSARSLRADYRVPNSTNAEFCFSTDSEEIKRVFEVHGADFCTLAKASCIQYFAGDVLKGWSIKVINDKLSILVNLAGLVDVDNEISRLQKEVIRLTGQLEQYRKKAAMVGYETKVPEDVRNLNVEKMANFEAELQTTQSAIISFESMKL
jgi:valyl-tRNA synthetase